MKRLFCFVSGLAIACMLFMQPGVAFAATPVNLIANSSSENNATGQPTGWKTDNWGDNTAAFTYAGDGHTGAHSLGVSISAWTNGDAKWFFDPIAVSPNTTYTFSDWYKSSAYTDVLVRLDDANGNFSYRWIGGANASNGAWKQFSANFTTPATTAQLTVLHLLGSVGSMQNDDASLTAYTPAVPALAGQNTVPNAGLETASPSNKKLPDAGWQTNNPKGNDVTFAYPNNGHSGSRSLKVTLNNYVGGDAYWSFPEQPVVGGVIYEFSNWYKSSVDTNLYAQVTLADGNQTWIYIGTAWRSPDWNHFDQQFTMPANAVSATVYQSIYAVGWVQTDDYNLVQYTPQGFSRGMVSITFDDGILSTYQNGLPLLQKYGLNATFYIITGFVGTDPYYMTADQVKNLQSTGNEVGSHTVNHPELIKQTNAQINTELKQSKQKLISWLGSAPADFATPHGEYNSTVLTYAKKYYTSHRSVDVGFNSKENFDAYNIKVQNVVASTTTQQILGWVNQANQQHTWLVLVYHAVDPNTSIPDANWNTLPGDLDAQLAGIKASGIAVEPINAALAAIAPQL